MVNGVAILILLRNQKSTCSAVIPLARAYLTLVLDRLPTSCSFGIKHQSYIFTLLSLRFPTMAVGNLFRTSVRDALARGITAEQVDFLFLNKMSMATPFTIMFFYLYFKTLHFPLR
jgi:hypothetical protein